MYKNICSSVSRHGNGRDSGISSGEAETNMSHEGMKKQMLRISRFPNLTRYRSTRISYHVYHLVDTLMAEG